MKNVKDLRLKIAVKFIAAILSKEGSKFPATDGAMETLIHKTFTLAQSVIMFSDVAEEIFNEDDEQWEESTTQEYYL